jgi:hypothetical protein
MAVCSHILRNALHFTARVSELECDGQMFSYDDQLRNSPFVIVYLPIHEQSRIEEMACNSLPLATVIVAETTKLTPSITKIYQIRTLIPAAMPQIVQRNSNITSFLKSISY